MAAGYEKRCIFLLENYKIKADKKIALAFREKSNQLHRKANNLALSQNGFTFIEMSGNDPSGLDKFLSSDVFQTGRKNITILVDYSCMTKLWYSTIINYFIREEDEIRFGESFLFLYSCIIQYPEKSKSSKEGGIHPGWNE